MSHPTSSPADEMLTNQAIAWLVRVRSDAATEADWEALTAWLEQSEAHREAFEAVELLSADIDAAADDIKTRLVRAEDRVVAFKPRLQGRWIGIGAAAAAAMLAVFVSPMLMTAYRGAPETYVAAAGSPRDVTLSDGTRIHMNAASTLTVRMGWRGRRVEMADAEASFDVVHDPGRPFTVSVGDQQVRDIGTEFNIRHRDGQVVVSVRSGVVAVVQPGLGTAEVARLTAGQQLSHVEGAGTSRVASINPDAAFAWTRGQLICDDRPLSEIVAELNRRFGGGVAVSGAAGQRRFSGVLELDDRKAVVRRLAGFLSLSVDDKDGQLILH
jgi:transmembrane sensor